MGQSLCPNCDQKVFINNEPEIGDHVMCETCHTELVVTWLNPLELLIIDYEDYESFDNYEDYEEDEEEDLEDDFIDEPLVENFEKIKKSKNNKEYGGYDGKR